jgi:hypothetical protein
LSLRHVERAVMINNRLVLVHCSDSQIGEIGNLSSKTLRLPTVNITVACLTNLTAFILARFPLTGWFYSHSRTLRNNWPIRSSCGGDDVKLTRVGAIWPCEPFLAFAGSYDTNVALFWRFFVVFPVGINSLRAHSRTRNGNILIKDTDLKIQAVIANNTLDSVFDGDSNTTITKTICSKGPKLFSAKGMASSYFSSDNCVFWYNMIVFDFQRPINRYNVDKLMTITIVRN